jgi:pimeloyl-ACP methyl ester carboxylesterase
VQSRPVVAVASINVSARESMMRMLRAFDRSRKLARPSYLRLAAEAWTQVAYNPVPPDPRRLPRGEGHVVLVIPAFLNTDAITGRMRRFLGRCGYRAFGWELGVNWGPTERILKSLRGRLDECCDLEGGPVSLIGVSLGGLLARDLAHDRSQDIAHVVTVVSPFRLPTASHLEPFFRVCAPFYSDGFNSQRLAEPLAMPSTAIFTRDDGLVAWETCRSDEPLGACFEMEGSHSTICRNPGVLSLIAQRLAPAQRRAEIAVVR